MVLFHVLNINTSKYIYIYIYIIIVHKIMYVLAYIKECERTVTMLENLGLSKSDNHKRNKN